MFSIPTVDDLSDADLQTYADRWFDDYQTPVSDVTTIDQYYNLVLPRNVFMKSLRTGSRILDVGAGDGSLAITKRWPLIERPDLKLYALSLDVGVHFDMYEAFEIKNFEVDPNVFPGIIFDAMVCAHFIEHMREPDKSIEFFAQRIAKGGRLYIEWPHPVAARLPSRAKLIEKGINISTFNFFDAHTHIEAWPAERITDTFERNGFALGTGGRIYLPWLGSQLRDHASIDHDETRMTLGAWAAFGWAQYLILNRR